MASEALIQAIKQQGAELIKRAEWFQRMIDRNSQTVLNGQKSVEYFSQQLEATNLAIDELRTKYRDLIGEQNGD